MMLRALALLVCLQGGTALRLRPALTQQCKTALVAGVCSAQLLAAGDMRIQSGGGESLMLASDCESSVRSQAVSLEVHEAL